MVHHNEIIIDKKEIEGSRSLKNMINRLRDTFEVKETEEVIVLRKIKNFDARIKYLR